MSVGNTLKVVSDTTCKIRALPMVAGVIIMIIAIIILVSVGMSRPYHESVNVTVDQSQSSHQLLSYNIDSVQTDEEVVVGTHVPGTSSTNCNRRSGSRTTSCNCAGYTYSYGAQSARCPGHSGSCNVQQTRDLIRNTSTNTLRCKTGPIHCTTTISATTPTTPTPITPTTPTPITPTPITPTPITPTPITPTPITQTSITPTPIADTSSTITCPYNRNCPNVGEVVELPVNLTTQVISCPTENWNTCTMRFDHNGQTHTHIRNHDAACEDFVNTTLPLFLTANGQYVQHQDHTRTVTWIIAGVLVVITLFTILHIYFMVTNSLYCGVSNAAAAVNVARDAFGGESYSYTQ